MKSPQLKKTDGVGDKWSGDTTTVWCTHTAGCLSEHVPQICLFTDQAFFW